MKAFETPCVPNGADTIVAVLALKGPPEHYSASDITNGTTTFRIVERGGEFAVMRKFKRQFLLWSWFKEDFVRVGYVPMTWASLSEAQRWVDDLKKRAAIIAESWRDVQR